MADIDKLALELAGDPLTRGYAGMTDAEAAADLHAVTRQIPQDIEVSALAGAVELHGIYELLEAAEEHTLARKLLRIVRGETQVRVLEFGDATKRAMLEAMLAQLVADEVLAQTDADRLTALGHREGSRAEEIGLGRVRVGDVERARAK